MEKPEKDKPSDKENILYNIANADILENFETSVRQKKVRKRSSILKRTSQDTTVRESDRVDSRRSLKRKVSFAKTFQILEFQTETKIIEPDNDPEAEGFSQPLPTPQELLEPPPIPEKVTSSEGKSSKNYRGSSAVSSVSYPSILKESAEITDTNLLLKDISNTEKRSISIVDNDNQESGAKRAKKDVPIKSKNTAVDRFLDQSLKETTLENTLHNQFSLCVTEQYVNIPDEYLGTVNDEEHSICQLEASNDVTITTEPCGLIIEGDIDDIFNPSFIKFDDENDTALIDDDDDNRKMLTVSKTSTVSDESIYGGKQTNATTYDIANMSVSMFNAKAISIRPLPNESDSSLTLKKCGNLTELNKTAILDDPMDITCKLPSNRDSKISLRNHGSVLDSSFVAGRDMSLMKNKNVTVGHSNKTEHFDDSMNLTCKVTSNRDSQANNHLLVSEKSFIIESDSHLPQKGISLAQINKTALLDESLELTCKLPSDQSSKVSANSYNLVPDSSFVAEKKLSLIDIKNANLGQLNKSTLSDDSMDFTCKLTLDRSSKVSSSNHDLIPNVMEKKGFNVIQSNKTAFLDDFMDLTCKLTSDRSSKVSLNSHDFIPDAMGKKGISVTQSNKTAFLDDPMDFTCKLPSNRRSSKGFSNCGLPVFDSSCQNVRQACGSKTLCFNDSMDLTCKLPSTTSNATVSLESNISFNGDHESQIPSKSFNNLSRMHPIPEKYVEEQKSEHISYLLDASAVMSDNQLLQDTDRISDEENFWAIMDTSQTSKSNLRSPKSLESFVQNFSSRASEFPIPEKAMLFEKSVDEIKAVPAHILQSEKDSGEPSSKTGNATSCTSQIMDLTASNLSSLEENENYYGTCANVLPAVVVDEKRIQEKTDKDFSTTALELLQSEAVEHTEETSLTEIDNFPMSNKTILGEKSLDETKIVPAHIAPNFSRNYNATLSSKFGDATSINIKNMDLTVANGKWQEDKALFEETISEHNFNDSINVPVKISLSQILNETDGDIGNMFNDSISSPKMPPKIQFSKEYMEKDSTLDVSLSCNEAFEEKTNEANLTTLLLETNLNNSSLMEASPINISLMKTSPINISLMKTSPINISLMKTSPINDCLQNSSPTSVSLVKTSINASLMKSSPINNDCLIKISPINDSLMKSSPVNDYVQKSSPVNDYVQKSSVINTNRMEISLNDATLLKTSMDNSSLIKTSKRKALDEAESCSPPKILHAFSPELPIKFMNSSIEKSRNCPSVDLDFPEVAAVSSNKTLLLMRDMDITCLNTKQCTLESSRSSTSLKGDLNSSWIHKPGSFKLLDHSTDIFDTNSKVPLYSVNGSPLCRKVSLSSEAEADHGVDLKTKISLFSANETQKFISEGMDLTCTEDEQILKMQATNAIESSFGTLSDNNLQQNNCIIGEKTVREVDNTFKFNVVGMDFTCNVSTRLEVEASRTIAKLNTEDPNTSLLDSQQDHIQQIPKSNPPPLLETVEKNNANELGKELLSAIGKQSVLPMISDIVDPKKNFLKMSSNSQSPIVEDHLQPLAIGKDQASCLKTSPSNEIQRDIVSSPDVISSSYKGDSKTSSLRKILVLPFDAETLNDQEEALHSQSNSSVVKGNLSHFSEHANSSRKYSFNESRASIPYIDETHMPDIDSETLENDNEKSLEVEKPENNLSCDEVHEPSSEKTTGISMQESSNDVLEAVSNIRDICQTATLKNVVDTFFTETDPSPRGMKYIKNSVPDTLFVNSSKLDIKKPNSVNACNDPSATLIPKSSFPESSCIVKRTKMVNLKQMLGAKRKFHQLPNEKLAFAFDEHILEDVTESTSNSTGIVVQLADTKPLDPYMPLKIASADEVDGHVEKHANKKPKTLSQFDVLFKIKNLKKVALQTQSTCSDTNPLASALNEGKIPSLPQPVIKETTQPSSHVTEKKLNQANLQSDNSFNTGIKSLTEKKDINKYEEKVLDNFISAPNTAKLTKSTYMDINVSNRNICTDYFKSPFVKSFKGDTIGDSLQLLSDSCLKDATFELDSSCLEKGTKPEQILEDTKVLGNMSSVVPVAHSTAFEGHNVFDVTVNDHNNIPSNKTLCFENPLVKETRKTYVIHTDASKHQSNISQLEVKCSNETLIVDDLDEFENRESKYESVFLESEDNVENETNAKTLTEVYKHKDTFAKSSGNQQTKEENLNDKCPMVVKDISERDSMKGIQVNEVESGAPIIDNHMKTPKKCSDKLFSSNYINMQESPKSEVLKNSVHAELEVNDLCKTQTVSNVDNSECNTVAVLVNNTGIPKFVANVPLSNDMDSEISTYHDRSHGCSRMVTMEFSSQTKCVETFHKESPVNKIVPLSPITQNDNENSFITMLSSDDTKKAAYDILQNDDHHIHEKISLHESVEIFHEESPTNKNMPPSSVDRKNDSEGSYIIMLSQAGTKEAPYDILENDDDHIQAKSTLDESVKIFQKELLADYNVMPSPVPQNNESSCVIMLSQAVTKKAASDTVQTDDDDPHNGRKKISLNESIDIFHKESPINKDFPLSPVAQNNNESSYSIMLNHGDKEVVHDVMQNADYDCKKILLEESIEIPHKESLGSTDIPLSPVIPKVNESSYVIMLSKRDMKNIADDIQNDHDSQKNIISENDVDQDCYMEELSVSVKNTNSRILNVKPVVENEMVEGDIVLKVSEEHAQQSYEMVQCLESRANEIKPTDMELSKNMVNDTANEDVILKSPENSSKHNCFNDEHGTLSLDSEKQISGILQDNYVPEKVAVPHDIFKKYHDNSCEESTEVKLTRQSTLKETYADDVLLEAKRNDIEKDLNDSKENIKNDSFAAKQKDIENLTEENSAFILGEVNELHSSETKISVKHSYEAEIPVEPVDIVSEQLESSCIPEVEKSVQNAYQNNWEKSGFSKTCLVEYSYSSSDSLSDSNSTISLREEHKGDARLHMSCAENEWEIAGSENKRGSGVNVFETPLKKCFHNEKSIKNDKEQFAENYLENVNQGGFHIEVGKTNAENANTVKLPELIDKKVLIVKTSKEKTHVEMPSKCVDNEKVFSIEICKKKANAAGSSVYTDNKKTFSVETSKENTSIEISGYVDKDRLSVEFNTFTEKAQAEVTDCVDAKENFPVEICEKRTDDEMIIYENDNSGCRFIENKVVYSASENSEEIFLNKKYDESEAKQEQSSSKRLNEELKCDEGKNILKQEKSLIQQSKDNELNNEVAYVEQEKMECDAISSKELLKEDIECHATEDLGQMITVNATKTESCEHGGENPDEMPMDCSNGEAIQPISENCNRAVNVEQEISETPFSGHKLPKRILLEALNNESIAADVELQNGTENKASEVQDAIKTKNTLEEMLPPCERLLCNADVLPKTSNQSAMIFQENKILGMKNEFITAEKMTDRIAERRLSVEESRMGIKEAPICPESVKNFERLISVNEVLVNVYNIAPCNQHAPWAIKDVDESKIIFSFIWNSVITKMDTFWDLHITVIFGDDVKLQTNDSVHIVRKLQSVSFESVFHENVHDVVKLAPKVFHQALGCGSLVEQYPDSSFLPKLLSHCSKAIKSAHSFIRDAEVTLQRHSLSIQEDLLIVEIISITLMSKFLVKFPINDIGFYPNVKFAPAGVEYMYGRKISEKAIQDKVEEFVPGEHYLYRLVIAIEKM